VLSSTNCKKTRSTPKDGQRERPVTQPCRSHNMCERVGWPQSATAWCQARGMTYWVFLCDLLCVHITTKITRLTFDENDQKCITSVRVKNTNFYSSCIASVKSVADPDWVQNASVMSNKKHTVSQKTVWLSQVSVMCSLYRFLSKSLNGFQNIRSVLLEI